MQKLKNGLTNKFGLVATLLVAVVYVLVLIKYVYHMDHNVIKYDCSIAEFQSDFPIQVKEKCRKIRSGRI